MSRDYLQLLVDGVHRLGVDVGGGHDLRHLCVSLLQRLRQHVQALLQQHILQTALLLQLQNRCYELVVQVVSLFFNLLQTPL